MSVRSHQSLSWCCCGVRHSYEYNYCPSCGSAVMTADRVLLRVPTEDGGSVAVVASSPLTARDWRMLSGFVAITADNFTKHEVGKGLEPAFPEKAPLKNSDVSLAPLPDA